MVSLSGRHTNYQAHQLVDTYFVIYMDLLSGRQGIYQAVDTEHPPPLLTRPAAARPVRCGGSAVTEGLGAWHCLLVIGALLICQLLQLWCW